MEKSTATAVMLTRTGHARTRTNPTRTRTRLARTRTSLSYLLQVAAKPTIAIKQQQRTQSESSQHMTVNPINLLYRM